MNILSLFDGMSCGQIALRSLDLKIDNYFASEIDKFAIAQTQLNFPSTIQLGDVTKVNAKQLPPIDLLIGGSPCQGFSFAGKRLNFNDPRSKLFFEFVRILKECQQINPNVKFLLENVRMKKQFQQTISDYLGINPVMINSALVSAQNRVRLYWSNIRTAPDGLFNLKTDIPQPQDRNLFLHDILEKNVAPRFYLSNPQINALLRHKERNPGFGFNPKSPSQKANSLKIGGRNQDDLIILPAMTKTDGHGYSSDSNIDQIPDQRIVVQLNTSKQSNNRQPHNQNRIYASNAISPALCASHAAQAPIIVTPDHILRRITPTEAARLQTVPDWYKWECSESQQYKMLGNGWTIEVIKHIFSFLNPSTKLPDEKNN